MGRGLLVGGVGARWTKARMGRIGGGKDDEELDNLALQSWGRGWRTLLAFIH